MGPPHGACARVAGAWAARSGSTRCHVVRRSRYRFLISTLYWNVDADQQGVFSITGALSFVGINHVLTYAIGQVTSRRSA